MPKIQPIEDVFSPERVEEIKQSIRDALRKRYSSHIDYCEIAIGKMVNGIALVYIGELQSEIELVERICNAQLAINAKGELVSFEYKQGTEKFFGYETYIQESDMTLLSLKLKRCYHVNRKKIISTDEYQEWNDINAKNQISISEFITCKIQVSKGEELFHQYLECPNYFIKNDDGYSPRAFSDDISCYTDFLYEEIEDKSTQNHKTESYLINCRESGFNSAARLNTQAYTQFIINNSYLLLCDNIRNYDESTLWDEWVWNTEHSLAAQSYHRIQYEDEAFFPGIPDILKSDLINNRYGVYDIRKHRTIIHVGETNNDNLLICGFTKLEFTGNDIITFDILDINSQNGIPYSSKLSGKNERDPRAPLCEPPDYSLYGGRARNLVTDPESFIYADSKAGEWYIMREGRHAGRPLCWLLTKGYYKDVLKMIYEKYLAIEGFQYFVLPYKDKIRDAIWLALDQQKLFEDIKSADDCLCLTDNYASRSVAKYDAIDFAKPYSEYDEDDEGDESTPTFEVLVNKDVNYIVGLINFRKLYVEQTVIDELKERHKGDEEYLANLWKVDLELDYWNDEIEMAKEERKYYEDWGYRQAFEDDPEAEWNID